MFCLALIAAAASAAFSYYPADAVVAEASSPIFSFPENGTVVASASSAGFPYLPPGSVVSSSSSAAFAALSANERRNPSLSFKVAAGEQVRPDDSVPTWARIDEDAIASVVLDTTALTVGTKSYVTATVSGLPGGFKFEAKSLRVVRDAKRALKDGGYTVKATVKNASGYSEVRTYALTVAAGEVTGIVEVAAPVATGVPVMLWCDAAKGSVKGTGVVAAGKSVSVSAKAKSGYVFAGWYADPGFAEPYAFADGKDYREASHSVTPGSALYLFARFIPKTTKADPINDLMYFGSSYADVPAIVAESDTWYQGVALPSNGCAISFGSATLPTVTVKGLPAGISLDKAANRFVGIPTKPGTYEILVSVKNVSGSTDVMSRSVTVKALPEWAVGTFNGGSEKGIVTLTVGASGKISGKWRSDGKDWTLSAASFTFCDSDVGFYEARLDCKCGQDVQTIPLCVQSTGVESPIFVARRNEWTVEPWKTLAKELKGHLVRFGEIVLSVGASGTGSAKGTFVVGYDDNRKKEITYSAICSTVLVPVDGEDSLFDVYLYFPPKTGKFDGFPGGVRVNLETEALLKN